MVVDIVLGPEDATVRPCDTACSTFTPTVLPTLSDPSPLTVTAHDPLQLPAMMLTWLLPVGTAANPSMPVCAGGVVVTMFPVIAPYQVYIQYAAFGLPPRAVSRSPSVPDWFQNASSASRMPSRSNLAT